MLKQLVTLLLIVVIFAGGFFYYTAAAVCPVPLAYRIGVLDERFDLSEAEALAAIRDAESAWEDATGFNLFTYEDDVSAFPINFVFDGRQQLTNIEEDFRLRLDDTESLSAEVRLEQEALIKSYDALDLKLEQDNQVYEKRLRAYNKEVAKWNQSGGAPADVFDELEKTRRELDEEQAVLNKIINEISILVTKINALSEEGNQLVEQHNKNVATYNSRFGEPREFTQGEYLGDTINIYQFSNADELRLVLAHEMGHALHLDHVENESSIMYFLMGEQAVDLSLTAEDRSEFSSVCGDGTLRSKLSFGRLLNIIQSN